MLQSATFAAPDDEGIRFFETRIRPLLDENCYGCHSRASGKSKGGLRLDDREAILRGGDLGPAVVPGNPDASLMIRAVRYADTNLQMPPKGKLSDQQIGDLARWIAMGAPDALSQNPSAPTQTDASKTSPTISTRWAFQPPVKSAVPSVKNESWARTPVDRFILARLEAEGFAPARPADKRTLIRRATFDLTGLPPTPEEIEAFLADNSPDAFARVVDRLLASPKYGERWGRHWLDVVRYTDSFDSRGSMDTDPVEIFRYRDWVVQSFNRDLPYDQFIRMQIAGDVYAAEPGKFDPDGIIATGMLAIGNWPQGDADKEKMVTDIVDDQIDVVTRGIMGVTLACARCHDHKFDPFTQRDYYGMAGMFFSSTILPGPGKKTEGSPILHLALISKEEEEARKLREERLKRLDDSLGRARREKGSVLARAKLDGIEPFALAARDGYLKTLTGNEKEFEAIATERRIEPAVLRRWMRYLGYQDPRLLARPVKNIAGLNGVKGLAGEKDSPSLTVNTRNEEVSYVTIKQPARSVTVHPSPSAGVAVQWRSPVPGRFSIRWRAADADPNCGDGVLWSVTAIRGETSEKLAEGKIPNGGKYESEKPLDRDVQSNDLIRFEILPGGDYSCDTTTINLRLEQADGEKRIWDLTETILADSADAEVANPHADSFGNADVWRILDMGHDPKTRGSSPSFFREEWEKRAGRLALQSEIASAGESLVPLALKELLNDLHSAVNAPIKDESPMAKLGREILSPASPLYSEPAPADFPPLQRTAMSAWQASLDQLRANEPKPIQKAVGIREGGVPGTPYEGFHDVKIHKRGSYANLGDEVPRHLPEVLARDGQPTIRAGSGRRELAEWVANPKNPLTARVYVNRVWQHHFGEGIVRTPGNFGKLGEPPTHPELLNWLAAQFIESGWSIKQLHRTIMLSNAYQQSCVGEGASGERDPDNRLLSRQNRRRLEAEALRDAMLADAGKLDTTLGGSPFADLLTPRRTLYFKTVRSDRTTFGALFDAADPTAITDRRVESTVAPQALFLMNHPFVMEQIKSLAGRLKAEIPSGEPDKLTQRAYALLYGRAPSPKEIEIAAIYLAKPKDDKSDPLEDYCQILVCANEFMYLD